MDNTYVFAGNMPSYASEQLLTEAFSPYGKVEEVLLARSKEPEGLFMGYAFVRMGSEAESAKAIAELSGKEIGHRACLLAPGPEFQDMWDKAFG